MICEKCGHINITNSVRAIQQSKELIASFYFSQPNKQKDWKSATAIAREIGLKKITQRETRAIVFIMRENDILKKKSNGYTLFYV